MLILITDGFDRILMQYHISNIQQWNSNIERYKTFLNKYV